MPASPELLRSVRAIAVLTVVAALAAAPPAQAGANAVKVIASDATGVTLRLETGPVTLAPGRTEGRSRVMVSTLERRDAPGRPSLPSATTLIALPPGANARLTVLGDGEPEVRDGVRLDVAGRPEFRRDGEGSGFAPTRVAIPALADGRWPRSEAELGEVFPLRRQRLVPVTLLPVAYDEAASRLWVRRSLTVRVDFVGGTGNAGSPFAAVRPVEDRHWDPVLERVVANFSVARGWRAPARTAVRRTPGSRIVGGPAGTTGTAATALFDESNPEVRVQIDTTGFYALAYVQLANKGYPAGTPIGQVSVHRHEFREGENPPYETIELPIDIDDQNADGIFNGSDRIFVYVQNWAERSGATIPQRRWGDAEAIFATVVTSRPPLRFATRPSWNGVPGLTPLASYPWTQRYERDYSFFSLPDDTLLPVVHWTPTSDLYLGARPDTFAFETNHLDPSQDVNIAISLIGRDYGGHVIRAEVRNIASSNFTPVGPESIVFVGKQRRLLSGTVPGTVIGEGNVNRMRIYGRQSSLPPDPVNNPRAVAGIDYYDVTYWRQFRALRNYLPSSNAGASGDYQIHATGFGSRRIHIFDVTNPAAPVRLSIAAGDSATQIVQVGSEFTVDFQDNAGVGENRRYVVFASSSSFAGAKSPPAARYTTVTRGQLASQPPADLLIVTPQAFVPTVTPLANQRIAQGMAVTIAPVEAIYDEFNGGRKSAHAVKRYARYAFDNWNSKFLLLVGDASQDPLNKMGDSGVDLVPSIEIIAPVGIPLGRETVPSDPWYGCLDNDCDLNDLTPDVPELFIGRLAAKNVTQAADMVDKLLHYDDLSGDQTWRRRLLLSADDSYSGETFFGGGGSGSNYCDKPEERVFQEISDTCAAVVTRRAGLRAMDTTQFSLQAELAGANRPTCADLEAIRTSTHAGVTPKLLTRLNEGVLWWNWQGHANLYVLAHENLYLNSSGIDDKDALTNADRPFLFSAFSCHANAFGVPSEDAVARGPSLGEDMVALPGRRGAIGSWASTGYEILPDQGQQGWHINTALAVSMFENPPADPYLGYRGARVILGEAIGVALANYVSAQNFLEHGIGLTYNLLGDPSTRISIGEAQTFVQVNGVEVTSGQPVRLRTIGDSLHLEAELVSNIQITNIELRRTDGAGTVTIPPGDYTLTPAFPDTGAGQEGGRRFTLDYRTTLDPSSYRYTIATTDRYGVPGSFDVVFQFLTQLRLGGAPIADNDPVPPNADLSLQVLSPTPLVPLTDLTLTVDGVVQPFTAAPANADTSGREWILSWNHAPYPAGEHFVRLAVNGGGTFDHRFRVLEGSGSLALQNAINFPNPFEDDLGTHFSFYLLGSAPADLLVRVFTISGRLVYERVERDLSPGYHQLAWNGRDAEGEKLANGVYLCRMIASSGSEKAEQTLRLVKTRKPNRGDDEETVP